MREILEKIDYHFEIVPATSEILLKEYFRLRYQVYCVENSLSNPDNFPDKLEFDKYDDCSVQTLIRHRKTGLFVAGVRLVLPDTLNTKVSFPIEKILSHPFLDHFANKLPVSHNSYAEISRLIVSSKVCRKIKWDETGKKNIGNLNLNKEGNGCCLLSTVTLALVKAIIQMSEKYEITHAYALMAPSLVRLLKRFNIIFSPIGPLVNYYGRRLPCFVNRYEVLSNIYRHNPDIWNYITEGGLLWQTPKKVSQSNNLSQESRTITSASGKSSIITANRNH